MATTNRGVAATETFGTTSPVTGVAPTAVDGTDGQPVQHLGSVTVAVAAPSGQTFSGAGTFACYVLFASVGRWARYPTGDWGSPLAGVRDHVYEPVDLIGRFRNAYLKWVPVGVTFSGGATGVVVTQQGTPANVGDIKVYS